MSKFLMDTHLPLKLARAMSAAGYDTVHTHDLPNANATRDSQINAHSLAERRVVITKDADFVQSFTLQGRPYKLLLISTGNIRNTENCLSCSWVGSSISPTSLKPIVTLMWLAMPSSFTLRRT